MGLRDRLTLLSLALAMAMPAAAYLQFDPEVTLRDGEGELSVLSYSIPDLYDWTGDGLVDLIVGEGGGVYESKVRVYPNLGSAEEPLYDGWFYVQRAAGGDLVWSPG